MNEKSYTSINNAYNVLSDPPNDNRTQPTTTIPKSTKNDDRRIKYPESLSSRNNDRKSHGLSVIYQNKKERKLAKKRRQAHTRRTLKQLKKLDDVFLDYSIETAENERTKYAKEVNQQGRRWRSVIRGYDESKPGTYNIGTFLRRTAKDISKTKRVRFAKNIKNATCKYDKSNKPNILWVSYDSAADENYIKETDRKAVGLPILRKSTKRVQSASKNVSKGVNQTRLPIPNLPQQTTKADTFNDWSCNLLSVGKVSDANTVSVFNKNGVQVYKEEDVLITYKNKPILVGKRDSRGRYRIPLVQQKGQWKPRRPSKKAKAYLRQANSVYDLPSTEQAIRWMHAVCGFPVKSTWIKAIKAGNYTGWPMLTEKNVNKYYPETNETPKGHMNQSRKNVRSTKPKPMKDYSEVHQLKGKKVQDIYTKVYEAKETLYSDQTGAFPTRSRRGNKYIMVMVEIDSNAILVEPMKSRKDEEMIRAYQVLMKRLQRAGIQVKKHVLDNEISTKMQNLIIDEYKVKLEKVPPGCHRRNAAEVAIRNFKSHFLSILAGTADDFPLSLWDRLLPQAEVTVNLLRQSNATPTVSAYAHLSGPFDYNRMPLAPMGCDAQIHEKSDKRGTWDYHSVDGWYLYTSPEHYRTHNCAIKSTKSERLTDTIQFNHKRITKPTITHADKIMNAIADCMKNIKNKGKETSQQMKDLQQMMKDTKQLATQHPTIMSTAVTASKSQPVPRVQAVPRVNTPIIEEGRRITRSISSMLSSSSNKNDIRCAQNPKTAVTPTNKSKSLPRVQSMGTRSSRRIKGNSINAAKQHSSGPAYNTRSKSATPAAAAKARHRSTKGIANAVSSINGSKRKLRRFRQRMEQLENEVNQALAVMDKETGKMLNYRQLMRLPKYREIWSKSSANEFGRLANGVGGRIKNPTNTIKFIHEHQIPKIRRKDITYGQFVCTIRPEKSEKERTRFTVGGDKINYPGEVATPTADMLVAKMLINSAISTPGARCMTMDISNFYLMTPLKRPEYIKIKLSDIPDEIIKEYKLKEKATSNGFVFIEAVRGMYGLPQSGLLANQLLEKRLNKHGYYQSKLVPGLWKHKTRPIQFSLVVDDFLVKYVGKQHALHLKSVLENHYKITEDWSASRYIGMTIDWDYDKKQVHLSMPGYVAKALKQFGHVKPTKRQDSPYPSTPIKYGARKQYAMEESKAPPLNKKGKKFIQQVCGKFLYLGRAIDSTLLCPISAIASQSAQPTEDTLKQTKQLLDYLSTQEEAVLTYKASDMILAVHSDASYLSEPKARSRAGGHFFLSDNGEIPQNNGAILNIAHIIKHVMSSATEAELAALYIMAKEAVYLRIILEEMGHKQPPTPIQTDNAMANAVVNGIIQPKATKAMDMRFHWLRDRECQKQFRIYWRPGKLNYADYWTKHHPSKHHKNIRREFLTPHVVLEMSR